MQDVATSPFDDDNEFHPIEQALPLNSVAVKKKAAHKPRKPRQPVSSGDPSGLLIRMEDHKKFVHGGEFGMRIFQAKKAKGPMVYFPQRPKDVRAVEKTKQVLGQTPKPTPPHQHVIEHERDDADRVITALASHRKKSFVMTILSLGLGFVLMIFLMPLL